MTEHRLRPFLILLGTLGLVGLLFSGVAAGTCGGEEEEVWWKFEPSELVFTSKGQKKTIKITNKNEGTVKIKEVTVGSEAIFKPSKTCEGANLGSCTETVETVGTGNAYITFHPENPVAAPSALMTASSY